MKFSIIPPEWLEKMRPIAWEAERVTLVKKKCHEYDQEWRMIANAQMNAPVMVEMIPYGVVLGLRMNRAEEDLVIAMAKEAGVKKIYKSFIDENNELNANAKRFELELNYNDVRMSIAEALAIIQNNAPGTLENADENCNSAVNPVNKEPDVSNSQNPKLKSTRRYYIAASVACTLLCCASAFVRMSLRHT